MQNHSDYWVTIATVLPVLGLALLLVARAQFGTSLSRPRWSVYFDGLLFGAVLIGVIVQFYAALNILSGAWEDTESWRSWSTSTAFAATAVLFGTPLLNLLMLVFFHPNQTMLGRDYARRVGRDLRRVKRKQKRADRELMKQYAEITTKLESAAVAFRERPFSATRPIAEEVQERKLLVGAASLVEHEIAQNEETRKKSREELREVQKEYDDILLEVRKVFMRSMWSLFSASIGHADPADFSDEEPTSEDATPKLIVARPAPRPDDPPR